MKKKRKIIFCVAVSLLLAFVLWTVLVSTVAVKSIGPQGSSVGFASLNRFVRDAVGENMTLYVITDWLGLVPIATAIGFAILGMTQWIKRKSFLKVDHSILALGVFYLAVMAVYIFFEIFVVNYRPVLIDGYLEASYPSSTTTLVMCVMPTAAMQLNCRIKNKTFRQSAVIIIIAFAFLMVACRILSGVHWITDIIGGALFSSGIVTMYFAVEQNELDRI